MAQASTSGKAGGHGHLTWYIVAAIVLALAVAWLFPRQAMMVELGGEVFLRLLQMVVVPLVMVSVMSGILGLGDIRKLGRPGGAAILYYFTTTVLAVATGLVVVNLIDPGVGMDPALVPEKQAEGAHQVEEAAAIAESTGADSIGGIFRNLVLMLFTNNLLRSMVETDLLPLIVFSIIFAGMLTTMGKRSEMIAELVTSINNALLSFVLLLMKVAPLGIFCLVASRFGEAVAGGKLVDLLTVQGYYVATVMLGLAVHVFVTLPLLLYLFTRRNPYRFMAQMSQAVLTAFSTASSTATLPVTMETAEKEAGVSKRSSEFVLPLGATVNMDGTALYEAAAAIFIAQAYAVVNPEFSLTFGQQMVIAVTATLAAIGAAGIPEAGLVTMLIVLNAVGLPVALIGLILPLDWLLDRFRTAANVFGDAVGSAIVGQVFSSELVPEEPPFVEEVPAPAGQPAIAVAAE